MKTLHKRQERRGTFLTKTMDSTQALKRLFKRMMSATTQQGEARLIRTIFSH